MKIVFFYQMLRHVRTTLLSTSYVNPRQYLTYTVRVPIP